eukprot:gnl/TRDRNA2_/TRDRNA2_37825_c0_seq1.p1 gnl/TRDRNA2_/TRDRNA2_37825_c0~~gnl/TRDRNA2_/TRDRNA2_37825_c0_seq1.p1  ORF type:complete len:585 (-),score=175.57 gnl/TRDRNA2_/TRDRNA2_37825_c0_seq1:218-1906(-)
MGKAEDAAALLAEAKDSLIKPSLDSKAEAHKLATKAHKLFRMCKDSVGEADALRIIVAAKAAKDADAYGYEEALALAAEEMRKFEKVGDKRGMAVMALAASELYLEKNWIEQGTKKATEAHEYFMEAGDKKMAAYALYAPGVSGHIMAGDSTSALTAANKALGIAEGCKDAAVEAAAWSSVLNARIMKGADEMIAAANETLSRYEKLKDTKGVAATQHCLAKAHLKFGEKDSAMEAGKKAVASFRELGDNKATAAAVATLCEAHVEMGTPRDGLRLAKVECAKAVSTGEAAAASILTRAMASAYLALEDHDAALRISKNMLSRLQQLADATLAKEEANMGKTVGEVHLMREELFDATEPLRNAAKTFARLKDKAGQESCNRLLDKVYCQRGNPEKSPFRQQAMDIITKEMALAVSDDDKDKYETAESKLKALDAGYTAEDVAAMLKERDPDKTRTWALPSSEQASAAATAAVKEAALNSSEKMKAYWKYWLYMAFRATGICYGPRFRCVEQPHSDKRGGNMSGYAYAIVVLQSCSESWEESLQNHPAILDCCLQSGMAAGFA